MTFFHELLILIWKDYFLFLNSTIVFFSENKAQNNYKQQVWGGEISLKAMVPVRGRGGKRTLKFYWFNTSSNFIRNLLSPRK